MKIELKIKLKIKRSTQKNQPEEYPPEIIEGGSATTEIRYQPNHIGFMPEE